MGELVVSALLQSMKRGNNIRRGKGINVGTEDGSFFKGIMENSESADNRRKLTTVCNPETIKCDTAIVRRVSKL